MKTKGHVFKYADNVDTDVIIPARYLNTPNAAELALHCMEDIDKEFVKKVQPGDVIVAGWNFGCGSSREHAPLVIKTCGTGCVIAKSFARIFYRNAINIGLPILECPDRIVNSSKRPISISKASRTLTEGVIQAYEKLGPMLPNPGPILLKQVREAETAVAKSI